MNWGTRYVNAVKQYLPAKLRDDVGQELQSTLEEEFDEARERKGAELDEEETLEVIRRHGHPLSVAAGYQDRRVLISENLFPIYKRALQILALALFSLYVLTTIASISGIFGETIRRLDINFFHLGLLYFAILTLVFHLLDNHLKRNEILTNWKPQRLPRTDSSSIIPLSSSIASAICLVIWFAILSGIDNSFSVALVFGLSEEVWLTLVLWLKLHAVASVGLSLMNLFRPYWTPLRRRVSGSLALALAFIAARVLFLDDASQIFDGVSDSATINGKRLAEVGEIGVRSLAGSVLGIAALAAGYDFWRADRK